MALMEKSIIYAKSVYRRPNGGVYFGLPVTIRRSTGLTVTVSTG